VTFSHPFYYAPVIALFPKKVDLILGRVGFVQKKKLKIFVLLFVLSNVPKNLALSMNESYFFLMMNKHLLMQAKSVTVWDLKTIKDICFEQTLFGPLKGVHFEFEFLTCLNFCLSSYESSNVSDDDLRLNQNQSVEICHRNVFFEQVGS